MSKKRSHKSLLQYNSKIASSKNHWGNSDRRFHNVKVSFPCQPNSEDASKFFISKWNLDLHTRMRMKRFMVPWNRLLTVIEECYPSSNIELWIDRLVSIENEFHGVCELNIVKGCSEHDIGQRRW